MVKENNVEVLRPNSLGVFHQQGSFYDLLPGSLLTADPREKNVAFLIDPARGRLIGRNKPVAGKIRVTYHYGFSSTIGAGPYDRRVLGREPAERPAPVKPAVEGGGNALVSPLSALAPNGTLVINDSLTYTDVHNVGTTAAIERVAVLAENGLRPLIRLPALPAPGVSEWVFEGGADDSSAGRLALEGLFVSGGDVVLRGYFDEVTITCCTFDPGSSDASAQPPSVFRKAVDGKDLRPCRLLVDGRVRSLKVERSIIGPVRTRGEGEVEELTISDSIVQAIRTSGFDPLKAEEVKDWNSFAHKLGASPDPLSLYIRNGLAASTQKLLHKYKPGNPVSLALRKALVSGLNQLLNGPSLYDKKRFARAHLTAATKALLARNPSGADLLRLNRMLLEDAYPFELKDDALASTGGEVRLIRSTVIGPGYLHRLDASESILDDLFIVEDTQHGCVRFSARATGSLLPRAYESVEVGQQSPLFTTREFGQPGYAQLLQSVDSSIISGGAGATIAAGAEDGSEMGAFAREKNPIKERSLRIKYDEFMPLGLTPVIIYVT
jgi:hypothetical protein